MCFGLFFLAHWINQMSIWGRKKYNLCSTRRQSSYVRGAGASLDTTNVQSRSTSTLGRLPNLSRLEYWSPGPRPKPKPNPDQFQEINRNSRSHSENDLTSSLEPLIPPPLPPRRPPPSLQQFRTPTHMISITDNLQLPPQSIIPVLERNASIRRSRVVTNQQHPFVYFHFDRESSSIGESRNRSMNMVPFWIENEDLPPSYEEAIQMNPPILNPIPIIPIEETQQENLNNSVTSLDEEMNQCEKPKISGHFRRETSV